MPFIAYEGHNLASKTTQMELQAEFLGKRYSVKTVKSPTKTELGAFAKEYSSKHPHDAPQRVMLFLADTVMLTTQIKNDLKEYDFVLCDRYFWSTLTANNIYGRNFDGVVGELIEREDLLYPDQTVLFTVSLEERKRRALRKELTWADKHSLNDAFHNSVTAEYDRLSRRYPGWAKIHTDKRTKEDIANQVISELTYKPNAWGNPLRKR